MNPFIGTVLMFGGNFAPRGWAFCKGQLLPIAQNTALFSILGTTYGGDGRTTFGLPDLQGRMPLGEGNGPGLGFKTLGAKGGTETNTMTVLNMPSHSHVMTGSLTVGVNEEDPDTEEANGKVLGNTPDGNVIYSIATGATGKLGGVTNTLALANSGNQQPYNNLQPYQVVNYIIALVGTFPSRS